MSDFQNTGPNAEENVGTEHGLGGGQDHSHDGQGSEAGTEFGLGAANSQDDNQGSNFGGDTSSAGSSSGENFAGSGSNESFGGSNSTGADGGLVQDSAPTGGYGGSEQENALVDGQASDDGASTNIPAGEDAPENPHQH